MILIALFLGACQSAPQVGTDPVTPDVYRKWKQDNSYSALVEIIDVHLANRPGHNRASKQDVLRYLGKPNWGTINQDPKREWAYQGLGRDVPHGDKVIFTFNDKDELVDIGWISE